MVITNEVIDSMGRRQEFEIIPEVAGLYSILSKTENGEKLSTDYDKGVSQIGALGVALEMWS